MSSASAQVPGESWGVRGGVSPSAGSRGAQFCAQTPPSHSGIWGGVGSIGGLYKVGEKKGRKVIKAL